VTSANIIKIVNRQYLSGREMLPMQDIRSVKNVVDVFLAPSTAAALLLLMLVMMVLLLCRKSILDDVLVAPVYNLASVDDYQCL